MLLRVITHQWLYLLPKSKAIFCGCATQLVSDRVGNPVDKYSCVTARIYIYCCIFQVQFQLGSVMDQYEHMAQELKDANTEREEVSILRCPLQAEIIELN